MATFSYKCDNCNTEVKQIHSVNDNPEIFCYNCDNKMFKKIQNVNISYSNKDFHGKSK